MVRRQVASEHQCSQNKNEIEGNRLLKRTLRKEIKLLMNEMILVKTQNVECWYEMQDDYYCHPKIAIHNFLVAHIQVSMAPAAEKEEESVMQTCLT